MLAALPALAQHRAADLRTAAEVAWAGQDWEQQARAPELQAFAEALDPIADSYFDDATRPRARTLRGDCAAMDHAACTDLAHLYDRGEGTWQDQVLARAIALVTCEHGHGPACRLFIHSEAHSLLMYDGPDPSKPVFAEGCANDDAEQCYLLATREEDREKRTALFRLACELGRDGACTIIQEWEPVIARARQRCEASDAAGCTVLAHHYAWGKHLEQDLSRAHTLYDRACAGGIAKACSWLATAYRKGTGTPIDPVRALEFDERACALSDRACWDLATQLIATGGSKDRVQELAETACPAWHPGHDACKMLRAQKARTLDLQSEMIAAQFHPAVQPFVRDAQSGCAGAEWRGLLPPGILFLRTYAGMGTAARCARDWCRRRTASRARLRLGPPAGLSLARDLSLGRGGLRDLPRRMRCGPRPGLRVTGAGAP